MFTLSIAEASLLSSRSGIFPFLSAYFTSFNFSFLLVFISDFTTSFPYSFSFHFLCFKFFSPFGPSLTFPMVQGNDVINCFVFSYELFFQNFLPLSFLPLIHLPVLFCVFITTSSFIRFSHLGFRF